MPANQGRIDKILPNAAKKLLDHNDRHNAADRRNPQRDSGWQVEGEEDARYNGAQVSKRALPLHDFAAEKFTEHAR